MTGGRASSRPDRPFAMRRFPAATLFTATVLVGIFVWQPSHGRDGILPLALVFGVIPSRLWGLQDLPAALALVPAAATLVTAQFLHAGFGHLLGNVVALLFAGPPAEAGIGQVRYGLVFLVAGAIGLAVEAAANPGSAAPILGASASVAGIIGAAARRNPQARIRVAVPTRGFRLRRLEIPLLPLVAVWLTVQMTGIVFEQGEPVAFLAHAAGFVIGALLAGRDRDRGDRFGPNVVELRRRP